jgi:hypothetical protein
MRNLVSALFATAMAETEKGKGEMGRECGGGGKNNGGREEKGGKGREREKGKGGGQLTRHLKVTI